MADGGRLVYGQLAPDGYCHGVVPSLPLLAQMSGHGREMGEYALEQYTELKTVTLNLA